MARTNSGHGRGRLPSGVTILYEDDHLLVVDKPHGLLTVSTERRSTGTLYSKLTEYVRKGNSKSRNRIFIVHRLDRDASGVIVFAKTPEAKTALQSGWENARKVYLAAVHGRMAEPHGEIVSHLLETKALTVRSTRDAAKGKLSRTKYRVLKETRGLSLLEVELLTGRKHQIRVHMAESGHPIVGDSKYGGARDGEKRLALHAISLAFEHPKTHQRVQFDTQTPKFLNQLMGVSNAPGRANPAGES